MSTTAISPTTAKSVASTIPSNPAAFTLTRTPKQVLDSDDFMKLLSTQMSNQDPMKPMEDTAFIAQMASFSSLNQMNQMTKDFSALRIDQARSAANGYLGRQVTMTTLNTDGTNVTGKVTAVDNSGSEPALVINGTAYPLTGILRIEEPTTATTTASQ